MQEDEYNKIYENLYCKYLHETITRHQQTTKIKEQHYHYSKLIDNATK
jgi:hypothetical protein